MISKQTFIDYTTSGLSCIPCNGKRADLAWKQYQTCIPSPKDINGFNGAQIALICGSVSGGLVCIDFDTKNGDRFDEWQTLVNNTMPEVFSRLVIENTPSGGYHVFFKTDTEVRNLKLAVNKENMCMIETRGEGGYFVCYPSPDYTMYFGKIENINKISNDESEFLLSCCRSFNETFVEKEPERTPSEFSGKTPFDDFDLRESCVSLLEKYGWSVISRSGTTTYLKRPGKNSGISATWNKIPNRFYCFSTSTQFENNHVYKASAVYAILEHNGDFSAAARELYRSGYGERIKKESKTEQNQNHKKEVKLIDTKTMLSKILDIKNNGYRKGKTTGWSNLDKIFSVVKRQWTVITGVPSAGKSEFMDALSLNLAVCCNWKFAVFSPENYPAEMHYHKLIEKIAGQELRDIRDEDVDICIKTIDEHYSFIDALEDDISLDSILEQTKMLIESKKIDALIIDPWNEIELSRPNNISESDFIGTCLRRTRKFARRYNIHIFIVAHPTKLSKNKDGVYPIPELWDISGSAHWRNKADNGICVHRDYEENKTVIIVQKVKFKYCGQQGEVYLYYDEKSGRYSDVRPAF